MQFIQDFNRMILIHTPMRNSARWGLLSLFMAVAYSLLTLTLIPVSEGASKFTDNLTCHSCPSNRPPSQIHHDHEPCPVSEEEFTCDNEYRNCEIATSPNSTTQFARGCDLETLREHPICRDTFCRCGTNLCNKDMETCCKSVEEEKKKMNGSTGSSSNSNNGGSVGVMHRGSLDWFQPTTVILLMVLAEVIYKAI